ncbi:uncharacterized protein LOC134234720 isoform X4 [Saccostrea cucullata]|uniref:uncharacterized protein LOC134234720 isoform X4 n=1 Tax=Saccostrea cuccullata TaxID=36930 RepID=UPI002ED08301
MATPKWLDTGTKDDEMIGDEVSTRQASQAFMSNDEKLKDDSVEIDGLIGDEVSTRQASQAFISNDEKFKDNIFEIVGMIGDEVSMRQASQAFVSNDEELKDNSFEIDGLIGDEVSTRQASQAFISNDEKFKDNFFEICREPGYDCFTLDASRLLLEIPPLKYQDVPLRSSTSECTFDVSMVGSKNNLEREENGIEIFAHANKYRNRRNRDNKRNSFSHSEYYKKNVEVDGNFRSPCETLKRKPRNQELVKVSRFLGPNYLLMGVMLGLNVNKVEQIVMSYKDHVRTQIFMILIAWRRMKERKATVKKLLDVIEEFKEDVDVVAIRAIFKL